MRRRKTRSLARCCALMLFVGTGLSSTVRADSWDDAEKAYTEKRNDSSRAQYLALEKDYPQDRRAPYFLGLLSKRAKNADDTIAQAKRALEIDAQWSDAWILLGEAYGMKAKKASLFEQLDWAIKCREAFEKALALDPGSADAHEAIVQFCYEAPEIAGGGETRAEKELAAFYALDFIAAAKYEIPRLLKRNRYSRVFELCEEGLRKEPQNYELTWYFGYTAAVSRTRMTEGLSKLESLAGRTIPADMPPSSEVEFRKAELLRQLAAPTP